MKLYNVEYSEEARQDLLDIKKYVKYNLQESNTAEKLISKLKRTISNLKDNPEIYAIIDNNIIKKFEIRKIVVDNYIIFYRIKYDSIQIVRIMYGKRNWIDLLR